ncbi:hypothetical protein Dsin_027783 [Dipteronia sinensis]|uniref:Uncharacterized protein n=1 Tax=Dipteronia sinensis TaxID=43782 RepID=A0AAD9ZPL7_9ROSI|nr:hypothetical protein Dsin_027783 [Dipteronia sinensis]
MWFDYFVDAVDTIKSSQFIRDPDTIVSTGSTFKFGFFSPEVLWSSNVPNSAANNSTVAQLLDSGNLVLQDNANRIRIWESFQEPADTFLPTMKLTTNIRTGEKLQLTSWKSPSDPSIGRFSAGVDPLKVPEVFVWNDNSPHWQTGPWNGRIFLGITEMNSVYLDGFHLVIDNQEGIATFSYAFSNFSTFFFLNSEGILLEREWIHGKKEWIETLSVPSNECEVYGTCGGFGSCNSAKNPICGCLRGFEPKNVEEWKKGNWTSGCLQRSPLKCEQINKTGKEDEFLKLEMVKLLDFAEWSSTIEDQCRDLCLNNCSCIAYAFDVRF